MSWQATVLSVRGFVVQPQRSGEALESDDMKIKKQKARELLETANRRRAKHMTLGVIWHDDVSGPRVGSIIKNMALGLAALRESHPQEWGTIYHVELSFVRMPEGFGPRLSVNFTLLGCICGCTFDFRSIRAKGSKKDPTRREWVAMFTNGQSGPLMHIRKFIDEAKVQASATLGKHRSRRGVKSPS